MPSRALVEGLARTEHDAITEFHASYGMGLSPWAEPTNNSPTRRPETHGLSGQVVFLQFRERLINIRKTRL